AAAFTGSIFTANPVTGTPRMVAAPRFRSLPDIAISDASRSAGLPTPNGPRGLPRPGASPPRVPVGAPSQGCPFGRAAPTAPGTLTYIFGGTKTAVIAIGACMLITPRE